VSERGNGGGAGQQWWQHHDGRWYPPELARHPAARRAAVEVGEDGTADAAGMELGSERGGRVWLLWATVLAPLLLVAGVVAALLGLTTGARLGQTETADGSGRETVTTDSTTTTSATTVPATPPPSTPPPTTAPPSTGGPTPSSSAAPDVPTGSDGEADEGGRSGPSPAPGAVPGAPSDVAAADEPRVPESADDCKHGGWAEQVDDDGQPFVNQGDCVAYVSVRWS